MKSCVEARDYPEHFMNMPNRPNRQRGSNWSQGRYIDHDDRSENTSRRVSFKPSRFNKQRNRDWETSLRIHLEDEDMDMGIAGASGQTRSSNSRFRGRGSSRISSPAPKGSGGKRKLFEGPTNWYRVVLPYGNKYDKHYIIKTLQDIVDPLIFTPISWRTTGNLLSFFVDDFKVAEKLHNADRTIVCPDNFKILIKVHSGLPHIDINQQCKKAMIETMSKRFNATTLALDLTKFHADPMLSNFFCALFKPVIMLTIIDIMGEHIPQLEALNLQENRIHTLDHIKDIHKKLPSIKILHMQNNRIRHVNSLDALRGLPLEELVLDGNPIVNNYKNKETYVSEVRKRFPKLLRLDGVDLPPPVGFDIEEDIPLPVARQTFLCYDDAQNIIRQFLEVYFHIYDGDSREELINAYHENSIFSMTMAYPPGMTSRNSPWLNWYQSYNRNLLRLDDVNRRCTLLKQGNSEVVKFLSDMPKTKHDKQSFTVDLILFSPRLMNFMLTGVFREIESGHKTAPIRSFSRIFLVVPNNNSGISVINDIYHITNATENQIKAAFKPSLAINNSLSPVVLAPTPAPASPMQPISVAVSQNTNMLDDSTKKQMIESFMKLTRMNYVYSQRCLEDSLWSFETAAGIFSNLQERGNIPEEAFIL